jgi:hypothetical protein
MKRWACVGCGLEPTLSAFANETPLHCVAVVWAVQLLQPARFVHAAGRLHPREKAFVPCLMICYSIRINNNSKFITHLVLFGLHEIVKQNVFIRVADFARHFCRFINIAQHIGRCVRPHFD